MDETKPFGISKRAVWEAYRRVKENRGAAGVDHQSLEDFGENLSNNLYKLWNRLASGSYFPPPVLMVEIPKAHGGMRTLGIPTVADRIAQMVVKQAFEPCVEPYLGLQPQYKAHNIRYLQLTFKNSGLHYRPTRSGLGDFTC